MAEAAKPAADKGTATVEVTGKVADAGKGDKNMTAEEAKKAGVAVESNHNTAYPAEPIRTANLEASNDYNPQRRIANKANEKSDTVEGREEGFDRVGDKGTRPSAAEMERDGEMLFGEKMKGEMSDAAKAEAYGRAETKPEGAVEAQAEIDRANKAKSPGERDAPALGEKSKR